MSRRCACGAALTRPESIEAGRCLEDRLTDWRQFCRLCARPWSASPFCPPCLAVIIEDSRTGEVETWIDIAGCEGVYQVSSFGNVRSLDRIVQRKDGSSQRQPGRARQTWLDSGGYPAVNLSHRGGSRKRVHNLVTSAFLGPPPPGREVCHDRDIKTDNRLFQLRYGSRTDNLHDAVRNR
jgi:hypothetical protein